MNSSSDQVVVTRKKRPFAIIDTYLEVIDTRSGDCRRTGIGAVFNSHELTRDSFEHARMIENTAGGFLLDLYVSGDLVDTIHLDETGVELLTGVEPESPEHYVEFDKKYWQSVKEMQGRSPSGGGQA